MHTLQELADLIFPDVHETVADLEKRYPERNLPEGAEVTRFAPSPTGFLHTGSLFTSMVSSKVAHQSKGVFFMRLEDTDQKREIAGSGDELITQMHLFGIEPDEGYMGSSAPEKGIYGPYVQSKRSEIYKVCIKDLLLRGRAYPDFATQEELDELRAVQTANRVVPGYYGEYAKYRYLTIDEAYDKIVGGTPYVIRFKSNGNHENFIMAHDEIRGDLRLPENDQDVVIMKSDGLPTYHFAHVCDDHFMHTTVVTRGEEWIASWPIHIELFSAMGFKLPKYAHLPVIMKLDNGNKRKLSKRKDPEAAVSYFLEQGYPAVGLVKYLMTIANSNFEEWMIENPKEDFRNFAFSFNKMSLDGALFDLEKVKYICKETLAYESKEQISSEAKNWAKTYDPKLFELIGRDEKKFEAIMNIERGGEKPRKDYEKYSDIYPHVRFFYNDEFAKIKEELHGVLPFNPAISKEDTVSVLEDFLKTMDYSVDQNTWFANLKALAVSHGFAESFKIYKKNKEAYKGHVGDVAGMVRIALTGSAQSPNLYDVLHILGKEEVERRIREAVASL
jgi:glutamyl-tRNA synthetase